jgi:putative solute:sodium symporter small subunit
MPHDSEQMHEQMQIQAQQQRNIHWRKTRRLTLLLLAAWFVPTFSVIFFARELSHITLLGWPFPFYMAAQGLIVLYVIIVGVYVRRMKGLDKLIKGDTNDGR